MRAIAAERPDIALQLSMRRDLVEALGALERHELDLAFGNVSGLGQPLSSELTAELFMTDAIAALVSADSALADRQHITPADLARNGIWWPMAGSSEELRADVEEYARSIGAPLVANGANLGLEAVVQRVAADPIIIAPVVSTWPVAARAGVRVVRIQPAPQYPWYGVWRTTNAHPSLEPVLAALRKPRHHQPAAQQGPQPGRPPRCPGR
jgi:DNA-binding transcriptional LysR family regulator